MDEISERNVVLRLIIMLLLTAVLFIGVVNVCKAIYLTASANSLENESVVKELTGVELLVIDKHTYVKPYTIDELHGITTTNIMTVQFDSGDTFDITVSSDTYSKAVIGEYLLCNIGLDEADNVVTVNTN